MSYNSQYGYKKQVTRLMKASSQLLAILMGKLRRSLGGAWEEPRRSLGAAWSEAKCTGGQSPCAILVRCLRTASSLPTNCEFAAYGLFRILLLLFVLLGSGIGNVWGQPGDGVYYISNDNTGGPWYLWPAITVTKDGDEYQYKYDFLTTHDGTTADVVNQNNVVYPAHDNTYCHWVVKNVEGGVQLINPKLNKYVVLVKSHTLASGKDVKLSAEPTGTDVAYSYFVLNKSGNNYKISPPTSLPSSVNYASGHTTSSDYTFNSKTGSPGDRTWLTWSGTGNNNKPQLGEGDSGEFIKGLIQLYWNGSPTWAFTSNLLQAPNISDVDAYNEVTIADANSLPEGYTIRYTIGDGTQDAPTANTGTVYSGAIPITATVTIKAVVERYGVVLTEVAEKDVVPAPCATPVITYDNTTSKVSIASTTPECTFYYTTDGTEPTTLSTEYSSPFSINSSTTVMAIATKSGYPNSEIASVRIVLNPTITLATNEYTYDGSAKEPAVSSVMDGETAIATSKYNVTYSNNTNAGTATVNIEDIAGDDLIVYGYKNFTINPAEVTLTANSGTEPYDGTEKTVSGFTCSVDGLTFEGVSASGSGTEVGDYPVTFTGVTIGTTKDTSGNYVVMSTVNGTLTISRKQLTITADSETKVYDGTPLTKNSYTHTDLFEGDWIESVTVTGSQTNAGTSNNVPSAAVIKNSTDDDVTANYDIIYNNGTLEVTKRTLTVTANARSKVYGEADPMLTYQSEGLINGDVITGTLTRAPGENAGDYAISQGELTAGDNYEISFTGANLTITKAKLKISAQNNSITYGAIPAGIGVTYTGFVGEETSSVLGGTLDYDFSYTQYDDVGNYTITPKGLTSDNYGIIFVEGKLTVSPKEVGLAWSETTLFTYNGSLQAPTATATGLVNDDVIGVTVTGAQTNAGNHTATASGLTGAKKRNYSLPEANTQSFSILSKSIGDGTLADGYTLNFGEGNTILLTDDMIGSALVSSTDYSVGEDTDTSEGYSIRTVTGIGNYTGSFTVRNASVAFSTDTEQDRWSGTFVAEKKNEGDIGYALPEGFTAFIISDIQGEWAIPEPLNYIPADVPVLLVANHQTQGFVVTEAESEKVTAITPDQKDKNMLEKVTEATSGYDHDTQSAPFTTKQIYLLYKNEFVFNKAGNLKKGKVYLNPSHTAPAPSRLKIAWNHTTGIENLQNDSIEKTQHDIWYTIDGRRLSGKPNTKGLYIVGAKKIIIK